ncbi:MAG: D-alanyl-D-alanine carboxypeptidase [Candidatus Taylorbacteria bacterium]|nr:D-alanyl-D-alanine carboxypeptidase [Candidatus Taylorbacteria bacterium]
MDKQDKTQSKIYIQTEKDNFSGKRTIVFPKFVRDHTRRHFILHSIVAIIVGISVPYFFVDFSMKMYHQFVGVSEPKVEKVVEKNNMPEANLKPQGSDDSANVTDEVPRGGELKINPDTKGQYYFLGPNYQIPKTNALGYVVADADTGEVIIEKNPDMIMPIASISKLITTLVAMQNIDMHKPLTVTKSSIEMYGTFGGLRLGEKILGSDLLYPLLMESSNDAAEVYAENYGYDDFIKLMNAKAKELGMDSSSFVEPSGLSEKNVSTAADLQKLVQYITKNHPEIWDISRVKQYSILNHSWANGSSISRKPSFIGGKNGFTYEAHSTTASMFGLEIPGGKRRIAVTLMKSDARENDVDLLLKFVTKWVGYLPEGQEL